jgi:hypothetical protein
MFTPGRRFSQQTFLLNVLKRPHRYSLFVQTLPLAASTSGIDWNQVPAVKLLGIALGVLILLWAIRRMFGGRK